MLTYIKTKTTFLYLAVQPYPFPNSIISMHSSKHGFINQNINRYYWFTVSATLYVGVKSAKLCMTANGFSRVSKQRSHPLLFPFFAHAAYDWLFQWGWAFHSKSIHLKLFTTLTATSGFGWKTGETDTIHVTYTLRRNYGDLAAQSSSQHILEQWTPLYSPT